MNYILHLLIMVNIYLMLAFSLNLALGYTGLFSLSHAAFYGAGAYISTLLMMKLGLGFLPSLLISILGAVILSLIVGIPSLRLRGDYFVLATLGFQIIFFSILYNWVSLTRGPYGISGIPRPKILGFQISNLFEFFIFSSILSLLCFLLTWLIKRSPFGRTLKAIREDEVAAAALGKNIPRFKTFAFAISGGLAAIPGSLFAVYMRYIDPTSFTLLESVFIISALIIGGAGNLKGPVAGTLIAVFLPEILRFLAIPDAVAANLRQIIYGLMIILLMRFKPQGLAGEYKPQ